MTAVFDQDYFAKWLTQYFTAPLQTYDDLDEYEDDKRADTSQALIASGALLIKPPSVKIMITPLKTAQTYSVSAGNASFDLPFSDLFLVEAMAQETSFSGEIFANHPEILQDLLDQNVLRITGA
jgi:50S ribosomal protein L16 3-hydroxylase